MTIEQPPLIAARRESISALASASRRSGEWTAAAGWLAASLNAIDATIRDRLDDAGRAAREARIDQVVELVAGDRRDFDVVVLGDGTRVCWHLGRSPGRTRWVVEAPGERCR
jgi:hypothetical protein